MGKTVMFLLCNLRLLESSLNITMIAVCATFCPVTLSRISKSQAM